MSESLAFELALPLAPATTLVELAAVVTPLAAEVAGLRLSDELVVLMLELLLGSVLVLWLTSRATVEMERLDEGGLLVPEGPPEVTTDEEPARESLGLLLPPAEDPDPGC